MNRNQRKYGARLTKRIDSDSRFKSVRPKIGADLEEIYIPRGRRGAPPVINRCCYVTPEQQDFAQLTENDVYADQYQQLICEQYGFDPVIPETVKQLQELKKVLCGSCVKIENCSQYVDPENLSPNYVDTLDGSQWQSVDNPEDVDKYIIKEQGTQKSSSTVTFDIPLENIRISDTPTLKVIAKKFVKYKKDNIELRKLTEKIVCIEYDIYDDSSSGDLEIPVQKMRAFFSVKPFESVDGERNKDETTIPEMPSEVKRNFNIANKDLKLSEKEIEIIDSEIPENKSYLEDLKIVLRRNQIVYANRNSAAINLITLYEMALQEYPPLSFDPSDDNLLSKAELKDIKELIMKKCASSVHGICRKTIRSNRDNDKDKNFSLISSSIMSELLREDAKTDVFQ